MPTRPGFIWSGSEWVSIGQEAVVAPVSYQASAPSTPSTGDIWIDSNDDVPGIDTSQFLRWRKTAVGGETSVSGTDDNGLTLQYTANYEQVYLNGVLLVRGQDYTATNGTSITGLTALAANDVVEVFGVVARVVGDVYTQAQTNSLLDAKSNVSSTGLVLITQATIGSAVASVTVSNCFSSAYDNYRVIVSGGTGSTFMALYYHLNGITTGWYSSYIYSNYGSAAGGYANRSNQSNAFFGYGTANSVYTVVDLINPNKTVVKTSTFTTGEAFTTGSSIFGSSYNASTAQATDLIITPSTGTLTGGTIKVYGYK